MVHWPAPPGCRPGSTSFPSRQATRSCSPKCGSCSMDLPPTTLDVMHGDALGPPCWLRLGLPSLSLLSRVGGSVNGKLDTIRPRRFQPV